MSVGAELLRGAWLGVALLGAACSREPSRESSSDIRSARQIPVESRPPGPRAPGAVCSLGEHRCRAARLEVCAKDLRSFREVNRCQSAAHCNAMLGQCLVDPCTLGEHQCYGTRLQQCRGNGWVDTEDCGEKARCDADQGRCIARPGAGQPQ